MFKDFAEIQVGDSASMVREIGEADIRRFVELTGDDNPLHVDRTYAESTPFKDIVVHGMLGASFLSTIIGTRLPGTGALWMAQSLDFLLPVRLGDTLTIRCTVVSKVARDRVLELAAEIKNQHGNTVLSGTGRVKLLEAPTVVAPSERESKHKVVIVTGGSGDIGRAICLQLAREGHAVVVNYLGNEARASRVVEQIEADGGRAIAVKADVSNAEQAQALVDKCCRTFGTVSVLVNNASPSILPKPFNRLEWPDLNHHLDVQLKGAFLMCKAAVPIMKAHSHGAIVNITSQVLDGSPSATWTAYAVGKSALATFSRYLAAELGPLGITVNCVSPGMTDTKLIGDIPEKARLMIARQTPLRRLARAEDVAGAVAFLVSEHAAFITGETVRVNGGQVML